MASSRVRTGSFDGGRHDECLLKASCIAFDNCGMNTVGKKTNTHPDEPTVPDNVMENATTLLLQAEVVDTKNKGKSTQAATNDLSKVNIIHITDPLLVTKDNNEGNATGNHIPVPLMGEVTDMPEAVGHASDVQMPEFTESTSAGSHSTDDSSIIDSDTAQQPYSELTSCAVWIDEMGYHLTKGAKQGLHYTHVSKDADGNPPSMLQSGEQIVPHDDTTMFHATDDICQDIMRKDLSYTELTQWALHKYHSFDDTTSCVPIEENIDRVHSKSDCLDLEKPITHPIHGDLSSLEARGSNPDPVNNYSAEVLVKNDITIHRSIDIIPANIDLSQTESIHCTMDIPGESALPIDISTTSLKALPEKCSK